MTTPYNEQIPKSLGFFIIPSFICSIFSGIALHSICAGIAIFSGLWSLLYLLKLVFLKHEEGIVEAISDGTTEIVRNILNINLIKNQKSDRMNNKGKRPLRPR